MKSRFRMLALLCAIFAISTPLIADNLSDVVDEAEKIIVQKYPVETSIARRLAVRELEGIVFSDKTDEEKIAAIRAKYPPEPIQTGMPPTFNPAQLIFRQPLQWSIQSIEIAYDLDSTTNVLFSMESLYREEKSKSRDDSKGESDVRKNSSGSKNERDLSAGVSVQFSLNPLKWIQPRAGFQWVNTSYSGQDSTNTTSMQWNERAQRALTDLYEEKVNILRDERISRRHLTFYIVFKNNTDTDLRFNPQNFNVTVYAGENRPLADARPDTSLQSFRIPRNGYADLKFRAELNTTSALNLIAYMRSNEPLIRLDRAQATIISTDEKIQDAVQESIQVETVPFRCHDLELRIRKYNQGKATTVADAMQAVNAVFSPAPFEFNDEGMCVSLLGIPLLNSGEKPVEHRLPVIGLNGSLTSSPIPVSDLNRPLLDEGLSVDVWDIRDISEMWQNASAQRQTHLFPHLKDLAESGDVQAQFQLGKCYDNGFYVKKDVNEAFNWYWKAAEQGFAKAENRLAICYHNGKGVNKNYAEAVKWFCKAAEQGNAEAAINLFICYNEKESVSLPSQNKGQTEAIELLRQSAERGNSMAQLELGFLFASVSMKYGFEYRSEPIKWFRRAALQNNAFAQLSLVFGLTIDELQYSDKNGYNWFSDETSPLQNVGPEIVQWFSQFINHEPSELKDHFCNLVFEEELTIEDWTFLRSLLCAGIQIICSDKETASTVDFLFGNDTAKKIHDCAARITGVDDVNIEVKVNSLFQNDYDVAIEPFLKIIKILFGVEVDLEDGVQFVTETNTYDSFTTDRFSLILRQISSVVGFAMLKKAKVPTSKCVFFTIAKDGSGAVFAKWDEEKDDFKADKTEEANYPYTVLASPNDMGKIGNQGETIVFYEDPNDFADGIFVVFDNGSVKYLEGNFDNHVQAMNAAIKSFGISDKSSVDILKKAATIDAIFVD